MSRPAPRKSSLAGANPITPPAAQPATQAPSAPAPAAPATGLTSETAAPSGPAPKASRPKVSFYQDVDESKRMRGALLHTLATEGPRTLSEFISRAIMTEVERLEAKYNDGRPFPPVAAGEIPQGHPVGR